MKSSAAWRWLGPRRETGPGAASGAQRGRIWDDMQPCPPLASTCGAHYAPAATASPAQPSWRATTLAEARPSRREGGRPSGEFFWIYAGLAASLILRLSLLNHRSGDFQAFLSKWYDLFAAHGRWGAFRVMAPRSVYPPLYMYLLSLSTLLPIPKLYAVKAISIFSDFAAAWFVWRILRRECRTERRAWAGLTAFLFLPTVVMNGALWGQCDVVYTGCFLASLFYLLEERPGAALVAFGLACCLKPQAVFWCPLLAGLLFSGRLSWKWLWIPPAVYVGCGLPAVAAGWSFSGMMTQMISYGKVAMAGLAFGAPNWYQWVPQKQSDVFWTIGVALTLMATALFVLWMREGPPEHLTRGQWLVSMATLSVLFPPFLLPWMHERYFFAADVLSVLYAVCLRRGVWVALLVQFASAFSYAPYLFQREPVPRWLLALCVLGAIGLVLRGLAAPWEWRSADER